jgi:hypothetical protein
MVRTSARRAERSEVLERSERTEGRRFESGPAHHNDFLSVDLKLFCVETVGNCVISCFK